MLCTALIEYLENLLTPQNYTDFQPNGLQIAGKKNIKKIVTGVSANQALIDAAIAAEADALLVHHGFFWKNEPVTLTGLRYQRIAALVKQDINLIAYHLPLDGHQKFGNNIQLAHVLGIACTAELSSQYGKGVGLLGRLPDAIDAEIFAQKIAKELGRIPTVFAKPHSKIQTIAWCTGAAESLLFSAKEAGADAFITGEISEKTPAIAKELNIALYAAGHHATERYGVQALGAEIADTFCLEHTFIDIDNPI